MWYAIAQSCSHCGSEDARLKCHQCGPSKVLCSSCDDTIHSSMPIHDRKVWLRGVFQPISPTSALYNEEIVDQGSLIHILAVYEYVP